MQEQKLALLGTDENLVGDEPGKRRGEYLWRNIFTIT